MAATFAQMIQSAFPDAQTGKDFTFRSDAEGHPEIDYWNSEKLGHEPNLTSLHAEYMKRIRKRKECEKYCAWVHDNQNYSRSGWTVLHTGNP